MLILTLIAVLIGVVLGLRFRMLVLLPIICGGIAIIVVDGVARGDGFSQIAFATVATVAALQAGLLSRQRRRRYLERRESGQSSGRCHAKPNGALTSA